MSKNSGTSIKRFIATIPMFVMMIIIFIFSSETGEESGSLSLKLAGWVSDIIGKFGGAASAEALQLPIRKMAHMTEYALLAITAMWAFWGCKKRYIIAFVVAVIYAVLDELHQVFVPGRDGNVIDVLIDSGGGMLGLILYKVIFFRRK